MTSMGMTGLSAGQIAESFQLQKSYNEQEKYKRLGELMTDEEKIVATSINTASGRNALCGLGNEFGPLELQKSDETKIYDQFKQVMKKGKRKSDEGSLDKEGKYQKVSNKAPQEDLEKLDDNASGDSKSKSDGALEKVFAKIYGFPAWPAEVLDINPDGKRTVLFQNGKTGKNADICEFTVGNLKKFATNNKFKKSGPQSKAIFLKEAEKWGLV